MLPQSGLPALLAACRSHVASSEQPLNHWQRVFESRASAKVPKCRLDFALGSDVGTLHTASIDGLDVLSFAKRRTVMCLEAHRATVVSVGDNAPEWLKSMGYSLSYELLKRGHVFRHNRTTLKIFQLCGRDSTDWTPISDVLTVEAVVEGVEDVKSLVAEADVWIDLLEAHATIQPVTIQGAGPRGSATAVQQHTRTAASGQQVYRIS